MSVAERAPPTRARRLQVFAHTAALRTALRRALVAAGSPYRLLATGTTSESGDAPDAIVLDIDLPGSSGFDLLRQMVENHPNVPIHAIVARESDRITARREARGSGATGVFVKPEGDSPNDYRDLARRLVEELTGQRTIESPRPKPRAPHIPDRGGRSRALRQKPQVLVIASSTGGPQALITLFSKLSPAKVRIPVLIVQHMPAAFTPILAEHITRASEWRAVEAVAGEALTPGEIRIAPGGHHLVLGGARSQHKLDLNEDPPVNFCRPSADVLFVSAAQHFGRAVLGVVLTGMGNDGAAGAQAIKAAGGAIYVQDEATSVVWGMPGATVSAGAYDRVLPLRDIPLALETATAEGA